MCFTTGPLLERTALAAALMRVVRELQAAGDNGIYTN